MFSSKEKRSTCSCTKDRNFEGGQPRLQLSLAFGDMSDMSERKESNGVKILVLLLSELG